MAKTMLVLGPASAGKTCLLRTLAGGHPDHLWHLVRLEREDGPPVQPQLVSTSDWAGLWHLRYQQADVLEMLPQLVQRITSQPQANRTIIAFEARPDSILRHALSFDLRAFILPPIQDERLVFRSADQSRSALQQILRDSSTFSAQTVGLDEVEADEPDPLRHPLGPALKMPQAAELNESQIERFLAGPLGSELAARVHLQPEFGAMADADIVILNTAAGECFCESDTCWHKIQALLRRLHKPTGRMPLTCACDLSDIQDPCLVRILRRMGESLCRV